MSEIATAGDPFIATNAWADPRWRTVVPIVVVIVAGLFRLTLLASPDQPVWDEHYYMRDAFSDLEGSRSDPITWDGLGPHIEEERTWVHPPLGKLFMAASAAVFGEHPWAARLPGALLGIVQVLLLYFLAFALWRSVWWAGLAGSFLALDGLSIVTSRLAMLDIYCATFLLAGFYFVVRHRLRRPGHGSVWLIASGVAFGAAVASKWIAVPALVLAVVLAIRWRRQDDEPTAFRLLVIAFAAIPVGIYVVAYLAYWIDHGPDVIGFIQLQWSMLTYHTHWLPGRAAGSVTPLSWPLLRRPEIYLWREFGDRSMLIVPIGNVVVWWGFLLALPPLILTWARHRDWRDGLILAAGAVLYFPWLLFNRPQYLFYMLPVVPFMALGLVAAIKRIRAPWASRVGVMVGLAALAAALAFLPLWLGLTVPREWIQSIEWLPGWTWTWG